MKIALLGDIALFGRFDRRSKSEVKRYYSAVKEYLEDFDYVIGNLETPFVETGGTHGYKSAYISAHPENVKALKYIGVNVVNLANNHVYDYGQAGYESTLQCLYKAGIRYFGIEEQPVLLCSASTKVAIHGYCSYNTNPMGIYRRGRFGINALDVPKVIAAVKGFAEKGYFNVVSIHSGEEHVNYPNLDNIIFARLLAELCPYVYYGHHPHVLQGLEILKGSIIAYSLGNFCFDDVYTSKSSQPLIKQSKNNKSSIILSLDFKNGKIIKHEITGIFAGQKKMTVSYKKSVENLRKYSQALSLNKGEYQKRRKKLLNEYIERRKLMRNFCWYIKRMNFSNAMMLYSAYINKKRYSKYVSRHLKK